MRPTLLRDSAFEKVLRWDFTTTVRLQMQFSLPKTALKFGRTSGSGSSRFRWRDGDVQQTAVRYGWADTGKTSSRQMLFVVGRKLLGTKKGLRTQRLAARKRDERNASSYQPIRIATI